MWAWPPSLPLLMELCFVCLPSGACPLSLGLLGLSSDSGVYRVTPMACLGAAAGWRQCPFSGAVLLF